MGEHISSITTEDDTSPVAMHFMDHHKSVATGMQCMVIHKLELSNRRGDWDKILQQKEAKWIFLLDSMTPKGLNSDSSLVFSVRCLPPFSLFPPPRIPPPTLLSHKMYIWSAQKQF